MYKGQELKNIPVMLIVGEQEAANQTLSGRRKGQGDLGAMGIDAFGVWFQEQLAAEEDAE